MNFSKYTLVAIEIAKDAGKILKKGFTSNYKIFKKSGVHNLVTEYDLKSEKMILSSLKKAFPQSCFISEEKGEIGSNKKLKWIIDPLDGTVNYAHHIPFFCVNIALQIDLKTFSAVTYNPLSEELFIAEKNKGAYLNNQQLKVSDTTSIEKAILATGFPYNLKENPENCIERFLDFLKIGVPIRRLGSAALDLAYVAAGRLDAFWETNLGPWDCAAGCLIIEEAGGKISSWKGQPFKLSSYNTLIASNNKIHKPLVDILKKSCKK